MMSIQKIKEDLKKKLSSKRYEHTMGVEYTSTCLAMRYGADIEKARLAGLLHDCAKYLSSEEKLSECEHTTGCPEMSLLDKIVFIADYMEANRNQAEDLPEVRALAFKDLDACLRLILEDTIAYLAKKKSVTDPMTQKTFDYYKENK